jgi:hypothetical protein
MICRGPPLGSPAFLLPLFTRVRGSGILGTSQARSSRKFAPNTCDCHHATAWQASSEDYRELRCLLLPDYCDWAVSVTDYRVRDTARLMALVSPRRFVEDGEMKEQRKGVRIEEG